MQLCEIWCGGMFFFHNRRRVWCTIVCFPLISYRAGVFLSPWVPKADENTPGLKNVPVVLQSFPSVCLSSGAATGYKISYRVDSREPQRWTTVEVGSNGRQFTVTGLSAEQTYVFRLIARTAVGWGEQLEALVVTTERRGQSGAASRPSLFGFRDHFTSFRFRRFRFLTLILWFFYIKTFIRASLQPRDSLNRDFFGF